MEHLTLPQLTGLSLATHKEFQHFSLFFKKKNLSREKWKMWPTYLLPSYLADNHSSRRVDEGECAKNIYQTHCGFPQKQQKERERKTGLRSPPPGGGGEGEAMEEEEKGPLLTFLLPPFPAS